MEVNTKRLLKLAALLEKDAKNKKGVKFDLDSWGSSPTQDFKVNCGTQACAFGLAAVSGVFKSEGLTYTSFFFTENDDGNPEYRITAKYKGHEDMEAAAAFFGLTEEQADRFFLPDSYDVSEGAKAERAVATRLRNFVKFMKIRKGLDKARIALNAAEMKISNEVRKIKESDLFLDDLNI